jgi:hypothetical protein
LLISAYSLRLTGWGCGGEVGKLCANAVNHGVDQLFDLLGLNLGFGEEFGGAEAVHGHFSF